MKCPERDKKLSWCCEATVNVDCPTYARDNLSRSGGCDYGNCDWYKWHGRAYCSKCGKIQDKQCPCPNEGFDGHIKGCDYLEEEKGFFQNQRSDNKGINQRKNMKQITPEIAKLFTQEERMLYRAGLLDENKRWSKEAAELAVLLFLEDRKTEMAKLAQEIIQEERESMMMGWGMFEGIENKKIPGKE